MVHLSVCDVAIKLYDMFNVFSPTEQQYFDIDKRLAESQEQILSATRDLQTLKEENKKLSEFSHSYTFSQAVIEESVLK